MNPYAHDGGYWFGPNGEIYYQPSEPPKTWDVPEPQGNYGDLHDYLVRIAAMSDLLRSIGQNLSTYRGHDNV